MLRGPGLVWLCGAPVCRGAAGAAGGLSLGVPGWGSCSPATSDGSGLAALVGLVVSVTEIVSDAGEGAHPTDVVAATVDIVCEAGAVAAAAAMVELEGGEAAGLAAQESRDGVSAGA